MWELSAPGSEAEECFLRIPQTEHFFVPRASPDPLEKLPNVSIWLKDVTLNYPVDKYLSLQSSSDI
jgi:hypothetical protein